MFAFGYWHPGKRELLLARDRFGKKPVYYAPFGNNGIEGLAFASELRALLVHPRVRAERSMDPIALTQYLAHEFVPAPRSILANVRKLEPGQILRWRDGRGLSLVPYYTPRHHRETRGRTGDLVKHFTTLVEEATRDRLVADVPVGVFLSGGLDSSFIAACATKVHSRVKTFAIGFDDPSFDESEHARVVAKHLGTEHVEERLSASAMLDIVPSTLDWIDEPFADSSFVPTSLLARIARRHVTVALGGDGGDEILAGYPTFQVERALGWMPPPADRAGFHGARHGCDRDAVGQELLARVQDAAVRAGARRSRRAPTRAMARPDAPRHDGRAADTGVRRSLGARVRRRGRRHTRHHRSVRRRDRVLPSRVSRRRGAHQGRSRDDAGLARSAGATAGHARRRVLPRARSEPADPRQRDEVAHAQGHHADRAAVDHGAARRRASVRRWVHGCAGRCARCCSTPSRRRICAPRDGFVPRRSNRCSTRISPDVATTARRSGRCSCSSTGGSVGSRDPRRVDRAGRCAARARGRRARVALGHRQGRSAPFDPATRSRRGRPRTRRRGDHRRSPRAGGRRGACARRVGRTAVARPRFVPTDVRRRQRRRPARTVRSAPRPADRHRSDPTCCAGISTVFATSASTSRTSCSIT